MSRKDAALRTIESPPAALGMDREINDLRGLIEKLQGMARDGENLDPQFIALADTLGRVYTQLATLIKTQMALRQDLDVAAAIHQAAHPRASSPRARAPSAPGERRCGGRSIPTAR